VIRGLGYNYQDVAKKLGLSSGYMSRLSPGQDRPQVPAIVTSPVSSDSSRRRSSISPSSGQDTAESSALRYPDAHPARLVAEQLAQGDRGLNSAAEDEEMERRVSNALRKLLAPPPPPSSSPTKEEMEKMMERMLLKFYR